MAYNLNTKNLVGVVTSLLEFITSCTVAIKKKILNGATITDNDEGYD